MTLTIGLNLFTAAAVVDHCFSLGRLRGLEPWMAIVAYLGLLGVHYVAFVHLRIADDMIERYRDESEIQAQNGSLLASGYVIASVAVPFVLALLSME